MENSEERKPLLDKGERSHEPQRIKPKRLIIIEPMIVLSALAGWPIIQVYDMYFLRRVGYDMGIDYDNLTVHGNKTCSTDLNDTSFILREAVQAEAARWQLYLSLGGFLPYLLAKIIYGALSDRIGRRICFLLPPLASMYIASITLLIIHFNLPVQYFFLINLDAFLGGETLMFIGMYAYLADTTSRKWFAIRVSILDFVLMISGGVASMGVGYFIKFQGYAIPCIYVICGKFLTFLYAFFFIPETIPKPSSDSKNESEGNNKTGQGQSVCQRFGIFVKRYLTCFYILTKDNGSGRLWKIWLLCSSYFLYEIYSATSIRSQYLQNAPLCWGAILLGYYGTADLFLHALGCCFVALKRCLAEHWILVIAKCSSVIEYVVLLLATTTPVMFMVPVAGMCSFLAIPMMKSILSSYVGLDEQASLFAAIYCISSVCELVSKSIVNNVYAATLLWYGGFVFVVAIGIKLGSLGLVLLYIYKTRGDRKVLVIDIKEETNIKPDLSSESPTVQ